MAVIQTPEEEQEGTGSLNVLTPEGQELTPEEPQAPQVTQIAGTSTSSSSPSSPLIQPAQKPGRPVGSGSFTNLQQLIEANKPKVGRLSQAITGGFQKQAGQVGQEVEQEQQQFLSQIAENRARQQQAGQFAEQQVQQAGLEDQQPTQENQDRFQRILSGQETFGPDSQLNLQQQQLESQQLADQARQAQGTAGRAELIRRTLGGTSGQRALDELVLQGSPEATRALIEGTQGTADQLGEQITGARQDALRNLGELSREQEALTQGVEGQLSGAQDALRTDLNQRLSGTDDLVNRLEQAFQTGQFTPELIQALGLQDNRLFDVDPTQFLAGTQEASISNIATDQDIARAQALATLGGTEQDIILNPNVGGFQGEQTSALDSLRTAVGDRRNEFDQESLVVKEKQDIALSSQKGFLDTVAKTGGLSRVDIRDPRTGEITGTSPTGVSDEEMLEKFFDPIVDTLIKTSPVGKFGQQTINATNQGLRLRDIAVDLVRRGIINPDLPGVDTLIRSLPTGTNAFGPNNELANIFQTKVNLVLDPRNLKNKFLPENVIQSGENELVRKFETRKIFEN